MMPRSILIKNEEKEKNYNQFTNRTIFCTHSVSLSCFGCIPISLGFGLSTFSSDLLPGPGADGGTYLGLRV